MNTAQVQGSGYEVRFGSLVNTGRGPQLRNALVASAALLTMGQTASGAAPDTALSTSQPEGPR
jgi:hypothetical protein